MAYGQMPVANATSRCTSAVRSTVYSRHGIWPDASGQCDFTMHKCSTLDSVFEAWYMARCQWPMRLHDAQVQYARQCIRGMVYGQMPVANATSRCTSAVRSTVYSRHG